MSSAAPTQFGPFQVRGVLGQGGMGTVFLAWDPARQREVAVKTLAVGRGAGEKAKHRFQREIRALAGLRHPGLLPILDAGEEQGVPWFALPRVTGGSLEERLRSQGPLSLEETFELGLQLCAALDVAHQAGILHRDLKPDNVLLDAQGRYLLADFGLAKDLANEASIDLSATGALQGTPGYWAPEQASGRGKEASVATDVYGLGALLYAALTGRPPIKGESMVELIMGAIEVAPVPASEEGDSCPALDALLARCLAKSPADRPAKLSELAAELTRLAGLGREALLHEASVEARRARGPWALAAGLVLVGGALGVAWLATRPAVASASRSAPSATPAPDGPALFAAAEKALDEGREADGLALLRRAADEAHPPALLALGRRLEAGPPADPAQALRCYRAAAEAEHPPAMYALGRALAAGLDPDADALEAYDWYRRAADGGVLAAKFELAQALLAGGVLEQDPEAGAALLREAAEEGEPRAMLQHGLRLVRASHGQAGRQAAGVWFRKAAEAGEPQAMVELGQALTRGWGVEANLEEATRWYRRATERGSLAGTHAYALALAKGRGVTADPAESARLLERAARAGHAPAMVALGQAYLAGRGVAKSQERAREWFQRAVELESGAAMHAMAALCLARSDRAEAIKWIERGARLGYTPSMIQHAGVLLQRGERERAQAWSRKAAEAGDPSAMVQLAEFLLRSDRAQSVVWYQRAAELGHTNAMLMLGWLAGRERPPRDREAIEWYRKAAAGGAAKGALNLAWHYARGKGVERDPARAERLFRQAAEAGDAEAMIALARACFEGTLGAPDPEQGERWLARAKAARLTPEGWVELGALEHWRKRYAEAASAYRRGVDAGSALAMVRLADHLRQGLGVEKDEAGARALVLRSAKTGHAEGMFLASAFLSRGVGGPPDTREGWKWLLRAAQAKHPQAALSYATSLERGLGVAQDPAAALEWYRRGEAWTRHDPSQAGLNKLAREGIERLSR